MSTEETPLFQREISVPEKKLKYQSITNRAMVRTTYNTKHNLNQATIINAPKTQHNSQRESLLTDALCQALIVKKEIPTDRFLLPEMKSRPIQCPSSCHTCCKSSVTLDLTAVESLMIYLLNRDMITLTEQYTNLHTDNGYCPFLIKDKCIIHHNKPTACQMFMPFDYHGEPMCYYLAKDKGILRQEDCGDSYMNSNAYDVHGFMMMTQCAIDTLLPCTFFKHIYQGVLWWKSNYNILPSTTRMYLESILCNGHVGSTLTADFEFEEALTAGHNTYMHMLEDHTAWTGDTTQPRNTL